jgi:hypothetical protein
MHLQANGLVSVWVIIELNRFCARTLVIMGWMGGLDIHREHG